MLRARGHRKAFKKDHLQTHLCTSCFTGTDGPAAAQRQGDSAHDWIQPSVKGLSRSDPSCPAIKHQSVEQYKNI